MAKFSKIKPHPDSVDYFRKLPFYNKPIQKPKVKRLKNIDRLAELPFYEQLNVIKTNQVFQRICKVVQSWNNFKKVPILLSEASKSSIKNLFSDLLNETKGFNYQNTVKVLLKEYQLSGRNECVLVYFNSVTKTVIN